MKKKGSGGLVLLKRKLTFTFDDGMLSNYTFTAKALKDYGFSATFFITAIARLWDGTELEEPQISWQQLKEMSDDGFEIANHSYSHDSVESLSKEKLTYSIKDMEQAMKSNGLPKPVTFGYPSYRATVEAAEILKNLDYKYCRAGYKPREPNFENFDRHLACAPWDRKEVSYYIPGETDPQMIFVTGVLNGNIRNPCYTSELFIKDLEGTPDGAIPVFAGHGMPLEIRQKAFIEMLEYCSKNDWEPVAFRDI